MMRKTLLMKVSTLGLAMLPIMSTVTLAQQNMSPSEAAEAFERLSQLSDSQKEAEIYARSLDLCKRTLTDNQAEASLQSMRTVGGQTWNGFIDSLDEFNYFQPGETMREYLENPGFERAMNDCYGDDMAPKKTMIRALLAADSLGKGLALLPRAVLMVYQGAQHYVAYAKYNTPEAQENLKTADRLLEGKEASVHASLERVERINRVKSGVRNSAAKVSNGAKAVVAFPGKVKDTAVGMGESVAISTGELMDSAKKKVDNTVTSVKRLGHAVKTVASNEIKETKESINQKVEATKQYGHDAGEFVGVVPMDQTAETQKPVVVEEEKKTEEVQEEGFFTRAWNRFFNSEEKHEKARP